MFHRFIALIGGFVVLASIVCGQNPEGYRTVETAIKARFTAGLTARPELAGYLGLSVRRDEKGQVIVEEIQPDSPAAKAGIQKGDLLTQVEEHPIRTPQAFREWMQTFGPGKEVK